MSHKAGHDPRAAALSVLMAVVHGNEDSQAALNKVLNREGFSIAPSDKGLCTELVYGVLRQYVRLEAFVLGFLSRPDKLPDEMRLLLLQTLYEMAFLRVPHHAGVNWAVGHVRNRFGKGLASVTNGVLRSMQRGLREFLYDGDEKERCVDAQSLARRYGAPLWLAQLWHGAYGADDCEKLLRAALSAPPSGIRLNRARPDWEARRAALVQQPLAVEEKIPGKAPGKTPEKAPEEEMAEPATAPHSGPLAVGPAGLAYFAALPWAVKDMLKKGAASRQSVASYEALEVLLPATWPRPVWDCCAGRGGKSLPLLEQGLAVGLASDISAARLKGFAQEYTRLELTEPPCPALCLLDASDIDARPLLMGEIQHETKTPPNLDKKADMATALLPEAFATILIDAPCSGLGTLARRPEIKLRRSPKDLENLAGLQARILEAAWQRLEPGGCIVYLTCTLNPAENQGQIARFLAEHPSARLHTEYTTPFDAPFGEFFYAARVDKARL